MRDPSLSELEDLRWGLFQGQTRASVVGALTASQEFKAKLAHLPLETALGGHSLAIVTASSEQYAPLFFALHDSLGPWRQHLHVIDIGLGEDSKRETMRRGIRTIQIPEELYEGAVFSSQHLRALYAIPFLPQLVDAGIIMWIDADCWVQKLEGIERFVRGAVAMPDRFTICAMFDVGYHRCLVDYQDYQDTYRVVHEKLFGPEMAQFLHGKAVFTGGVHAARRTSPAWAEWQELMREVYATNTHIRSDIPLAHIAEQQTLNLVLHRSGHFNCLSSEMNWHCHCSHVVRQDGLVKIVPSGRVPAIVHLCEFSQRGDNYRKERLLYEGPGAAG